jgi:hypothetical protein
MLVCARSRAGSSPCTCAMWAWPHRGCRHFLAQWSSLPRLCQVSSCVGFWLSWVSLRALPSARPSTLAWAPPRALPGLPCLRPPVEGEDSPFFPSPCQASHCS